MNKALPLLAAGMLLCAGGGFAKVPGPVLQKRDVPVCVLTGEWPKGVPFHYQAWDRCAAMRTAVRSKRELIEIAQGERSRLKAIERVPAGVPVLDVNNGQSRVLLYRDPTGKLVELPFGD